MLARCLRCTEMHTKEFWVHHREMRASHRDNLSLRDMKRIEWRDCLASQSHLTREG